MRPSQRQARREGPARQRNLAHARATVALARQARQAARAIEVQALERVAADEAAGAGLLLLLPVGFRVGRD